MLWLDLRKVNLTLKDNELSALESNIIFEYHDMDFSDRLEKFSRERLETIFNRFDFVSSADVFFKTKNTSSDETGMKFGIRLRAPIPRLFAKHRTTIFKMR